MNGIIEGGSNEVTTCFRRNVPRNFFGFENTSWSVRKTELGLLNWVELNLKTTGKI